MTLDEIIKVASLINIVLLILYGIRQRYIEIKQKNEAEKTEKKHEKRADELDKKIATRLDIVIKDQESHNILLNEVNEKIDSNTKMLNEHIKEGSLKANFASLYWYQVNQITHFWNSRDEKFKIVFDYWTDLIEGLALAYIDNKTKKNKTPYEEFHPIEMMERMIIDFNKRADSLICDNINNISFSTWLNDKGRNIHGKSRVLANELEANGMNEDQFILKMKNYIYNFGTIFTQSCDLWIIEIEKKKVL